MCFCWCFRTKSKMKFEIRLSTNEAHFLDATVSLKYGNLRTTLFTKPTDSHFYLNTSSYHLSHVLKKHTQTTVCLIATLMFTKIGLPAKQSDLA